MRIRIISFNVNGLKSFNKYISKDYKDFNTYLINNGIDILCVQETRGIESNLIEFRTLKDYIVFNAFNKHRGGIYGVSTFVRKNLYCCGYKIYISDELKEFSDEGRILLTDHGEFKILNCYFPFIDEEAYKSVDNKNVEKREKVLRFYDLIEKYINKYDNLILCGDINTTYSIMDHYIYSRELERLCNEKNISYNFKNIQNLMLSDLNEEEKEPKRKIIYSKTEIPLHFFSILSLKKYFFELKQREWLFRIINTKYIDSFRVFNDDGNKYTCWNTFLNLRPYNLGTRIDYILIPHSLKNNLLNSEILSGQMGSDHCPVLADLEIKFLRKENNILNKKNNILSFFKN